MTLSEKQMQMLGEAVQPLLVFLRKNGGLLVNAKVKGVPQPGGHITVTVDVQAEEESDLPSAMEEENERLGRAKLLRSLNGPRHSARKRRW